MCQVCLIKMEFVNGSNYTWVYRKIGAFVIAFVIELGIPLSNKLIKFAPLENRLADNYQLLFKNPFKMRNNASSQFKTGIYRYKFAIDYYLVIETGRLSDLFRKIRCWWCFSARIWSCGILIGRNLTHFLINTVELFTMGLVGHFYQIRFVSCDVFITFLRINLL